METLLNDQNPVAVKVESDVCNKEVNFIRKLWVHRKYFNIELFIFFYVVPSVLNTVAIENFPLEKACRVNYNYSDIVCKTILDKDEFGIDCSEFNFENVTNVGSGILWNVTDLSSNFNYTVCKAERDAHKLSAHISGIRAPIAAVFPFIVILFAGGWSDRYNKRKPCMMFPLIGEGLSFLGLFISALFFNSIPMEIGAYIEAILPAMFGGITFVLMAVNSFITIATAEPDRVFRFGIFGMFLNCVFFIGLPFSGIFYKALGYVYCFAIAFIFQVIAFFYVLFFIDEAKAIPKTEIEEAESIPFKSTAPLDEELSPKPNHNKKKSFLAELFDPTLAMECLEIPLKSRPNYGKPLLIAVLLAYLLNIGPTAAEGEFLYRYTQIKLKWNGVQYSMFSTFTCLMTILGTFIGSAILSKLLKISDPMIGIISALCAVIARPMFAFSKESIMFYSAGVVEMFAGISSVVVKTVGSSIVQGDEQTRLFAIFGVIEPIAQFIFPALYSFVYAVGVDTFPGAFFLFGELFYIPNVLVFIICYILLKKKAKKGVAVEDAVTNVDE